ncbi:MAG: Hsp20/alpha crystallin family protein [Clostridia bacterium]|nr:Hsp20/alpha crystallin family protein [Clostridia bacterium]MBQ8259775.1 Hsp20/alpha crystallin family protein [Clostridia bacterium]
MFELTPFRSNYYVSAYDPFKEMEEFERRFFGQRTPAMKTDIRETENAYILESDLPGFSREDIHAEINNGYLTIRAEHKSENEDKNESYLRRERSYGSFSRTFDLDGIDAEAITASFKNGVLTLELPKMQQKVEEARKVEIQ